jgi:hypothetical protein
MSMPSGSPTCRSKLEYRSETFLLLVLYARLSANSEDVSFDVDGRHVTGRRLELRDELHGVAGVVHLRSNRVSKAAKGSWYWRIAMPRSPLPERAIVIGPWRSLRVFFSLTIVFMPLFLLVVPRVAPRGLREEVEARARAISRSRRRLQ